MLELKPQEPLVFGFCKFHEYEVYEGKFEWKGCWTCGHFVFSPDLPYVTVNDAAKALNVSKATIRRWVKIGKLKGRLYVKRRKDLNVPKKIYLIEKVSVEELKKL